MAITNITRIGKIGNPYGGLLVGIDEQTGKYVWAVEDQCMGAEWEEISKFTYTVLLRQSRRNGRRIYEN